MGDTAKGLTVQARTGWGGVFKGKGNFKFILTCQFSNWGDSGWIGKKTEINT